jgi:hypothetical protein
MATNKLLAGLLSEPRSCVRGHGTMEKLPGLWALNQVNVAKGSDGKLAAFDTGTRYVASLYRCFTCGFLELVDQAE